MESKPLSSLYLCGDESDENAFGGISSFDNMDLSVAIPDNVAYENLSNHHNMGTVSEASGNSYLSNGSGDEILSNNVSAGTASLTQSSTSLSADDTNAFTSRSSSSCAENNSNSLLTELADNSLPAEKISNSELMNIIKNTDMIKTRIASAEDGFTDSGLSDMFSSVTSNLNCSDQNLKEVSCSNMTSFDHHLIGKNQGNEHRNGVVLNDLNKCSDDDDDDNDEADDYRDRLPSEDWPGSEEKEFNEDGEDVEDEEDDETEDEDEDDNEDTHNDENFPEMLGDGKIDLNVIEKQELTDELGCDPGSSMPPVPEAPVIKSELQDASVTDDVKERELLDFVLIIEFVFRPHNCRFHDENGFFI